MEDTSDWVHTHEGAETLLRYAALGATVIFDPLRPAQKEKTTLVKASREFTFILDSAPHHALNALDVYTLPFRASAMVARVNSLLKTCQAQIKQVFVAPRAPTA